jgi:salicylate hydroxylase
MVQPAAALIAADGVRSDLRGKIAADNTARAIGRTAWRATLPARTLERLVPLMHTGLWLGPNAHLVHYPIAGGRSVNIVAIVEEKWQGVGWSEPGDYYRLARHFARWATAPRAIVGATAEWRKWAILAVDPALPWTFDRGALLGDAAHAMPPFLAQGAAMAIEDAAVLADCLAASPADINSAFAAYESARQPRVARVHKEAFETGAHYHSGRPFAILRNTALRLAGWRLILGKNDWIYGWEQEA